jgi:hypothetical protein
MVVSFRFGSRQPMVVGRNAQSAVSGEARWDRSASFEIGLEGIEFGLQ